MFSGMPRTAVILVLIAGIAASQSYGAGRAPPSAKATGASAEVQVGLCAPVNHIVQALHLHARAAPITVWQFDDDALTLLGRGLRLRLRVGPVGSSEFTLKVADQDCAHLDPKRVPPGEGKCEYDVYGASLEGAASITRSLTASSTNDLLAGRLTPAQVLSPSQERYLRKAVGLWPLPRDIRALGPMHVQRYRTKGNFYDIDISQLPDDTQYAEISRKAPLAEASQAMKVLEDELRNAGVAMCDDQSSPAASKLRALAR